MRYLRKLNMLAKTVSDWRDIEPHAIYVEQLRQNTQNQFLEPL